MTSGLDGARDEEPPGRSLDVAPTRLRGSGGGRSRAVAASAALVVLIAGAIGVAQLANDGRRPVVANVPVTSNPPRPAASAPLAAVTSTPAPATIRDQTPVRLRAVDLAARVRDGSLDDRLVFVDGELSVTPIGCRSLATVRVGCVDVAIPGVGVPVHAAEPSMVWSPAPPLGAWLVTVARAGALVYLGSLVPDHEVPTSIPDLERQLAAGTRARPEGSLVEANGTLVTNIPSPCNDLCPPPPPYLADARAWANPALPETGTVVRVVRNAPEIPMDTERFDGTFLLERADDGTWRVVARYVPSRSVRVQIP